MSSEATESFEMDLEPAGPYLRHDIPALIQHERAKTANLVALILVAGVVLSLPTFVIAAWIKPDGIEVTRAIFDKWYAIISPLVGTAIGAYYGSRFGSSGKGAAR